MRKYNITLLFGHAAACFSNTLYGFCAVMLAPIYFPQSPANISVLASYGAFAAGYLSRPMGALFFGLIGDRHGRRTPLLWSTVLIGVPTITIGLLPEYKFLGAISSFLLIICRLLQGFFIGGEFTGVNLYISESENDKIIGKRTGMLIAMGCLGGVLATSTGAFFSMNIMPSWGWRIPFVLGGASTLFVYFFRNNLKETSDFVDIKHQKKTLKYPWKHLIIHYKWPLFLSTIIAGLTLVPLYCTTIFGNQIFKELGFTTSQSLLLNTIDMLINSIAIIYFGKMADKIGFQNQMLLGTCITSTLSIPIFMLVNKTGVSTLDVLMFVILLTFLGAIINGCAMPYIARLFPTNCRYSAVALSVTLGHALIGGTTPLMCSFLKNVFSSNLAPAFWVSTISLITLTSIYMMGKCEKKIIYSEKKHHQVSGNVVTATTT